MHVAMILNGTAVHDTRVMREAAWLARAGLTVTIVARSTTGGIQLRSVDGARLLRIPIHNDVVVAESTARQSRRFLRLLDHDDQRRRVEQARHDSDRRRMRRSGPRRKRVLRARGSVAEWREDKRTDAVDRLRDFWRTYDDVVSDLTLGASWRRDLGGQVDDLELAFGPLLDWLAPDAIHAHDVHVLGVAVNAAARARSAGRDVKVVYDAHEYVRGMSVFGRSSQRRIAAWSKLEDEFIGDADAVITVSPHLARFMQRDHNLAVPPSVILNVPVPGEGPDAPTETIRDRIGLAEDVPLAVYSGVLRSVRGVEDVIQALTMVPELHLAILSVPHASTPGAMEVVAHAETLGLSDRVHVCDAVPVAHVPGFLSSADIGIIPIRGGWTSYDFCLPNKFFECLSAGLPLVTSNLPTMAELVGSEGLGETFTPADPADLATAISTVLRNLEDYRARVDHSQIRREAEWRRQESALRGLYEEVLGVSLGADALDERPLHLAEDSEGRASLSPEPRVWIGPTNHHNWASEAAAEIRDALPALEVEVTHINRRRRHGAAQVAPSREMYGHSSWQGVRRLHLSEQPTIAIWEDGRPLCGEYASPTCLDEARSLLRTGGRGIVWLHVRPAPHVESVLGDLRRMGVIVASHHREICQDETIRHAESPLALVQDLLAQMG